MPRLAGLLRLSLLAGLLAGAWAAAAMAAEVTRGPYLQMVTEDGVHVRWRTDVGTDSEESVDYPDIALALASEINAGHAERGVLVCGSGVGASVAANKLDGIRAAITHDTYSAHQGVEHDDMNVLCLGARIIGEALAFEIAAAFTAAKFSGEDRHKRRLRKIDDLEKGF